MLKELAEFCHTHARRGIFLLLFILALPACAASKKVCSEPEADIFTHNSAETRGYQTTEAIYPAPRPPVTWWGRVKSTLSPSRLLPPCQGSSAAANTSQAVSRGKNHERPRGNAASSGRSPKSAASAKGCNAQRGSHAQRGSSRAKCSSFKGSSSRGSAGGHSGGSGRGGRGK